MLEYNRTYILEGINVNKTNASKECDICVTIGILRIFVLSMNHIFEMFVMI